VADVSMEARLVALGEVMTFPSPETLVDDVLDQLGPGRRWWRRPAWAAAAAVVLVVAVVAAVPGSRRTVARWLGFDSLRIEWVEDLPAASPPEPASGMTLAEAAARAGIDPFVATTLGEPVDVEAPGGRYVAVHYRDGDVDVIVATLPGRLDEGSFGKLVASGATVTGVDVDGTPGYWVAGGDHVFAYLDDSGRRRDVRVAADTLVWQRGGVLVRVEGDMSLDRALEIAGSLRAPPTSEG
jgi:hypothetical protein